MKVKELILFMKSVIADLNPWTCFISAHAHARPKEFDSINDMRTRELKNFLIQKDNFDPKLVNHILDRNELIQLALSSKKKYNNANYYHDDEFAIIISRILLFILLGYVTYKCRHIINDILLDPFTSCYYRIMLKIAGMRKCIKKCFMLSFFAFFVSCIIDIYDPLIQLRILFSWVVPSDNFVRMFLNHHVKILSLPVNPSLVMTNKKLSSFINYGIDLGPVITLYILKFIKNKLEDFACSALLKYREEKRKRKRKANESYVTINSSDDLNFADENFKLD